MENWKPGDVVLLDVGTESERIGLRDDKNEGWRTMGGYMGDATCPAWATHRPLVVIDPEDREAVERLLCHLADALAWGPHNMQRETYVEPLQAALREFANPTLPKPPEPQGLGAVVEDAKGRRWVRFGRPDSPPRWFDAGVAAGFPQRWENVAAVKVLSEGVPA